MRLWWRRLWRRAPDTTVEAQAALERLEGRDEQVERLRRELRERQRVNNFSGMVAAAIARGTRGGA